MSAGLPLPDFPRTSSPTFAVASAGAGMHNGRHGPECGVWKIPQGNAVTPDPGAGRDRRTLRRPEGPRAAARRNRAAGRRQYRLLHRARTGPQHPPGPAAAERNLTRWIILDPLARELFRDWKTVASDAVGTLRVDVGRHPSDAQAAQLVGELAVHSEQFRQWWAGHRVARDRQARCGSITPSSGTWN